MCNACCVALTPHNKRMLLMKGPLASMFSYKISLILPVETCLSSNAFVLSSGADLKEILCIARCRYKWGPMKDI